MYDLSQRRTNVAISFLDPATNTQQLQLVQPTATIIEPLTFSMLDGIDEEGTWETTVRLDDEVVRGGAAFRPFRTLPVDPGNSIVIATWTFAGGTPKTPSVSPAASSAGITVTDIDDTNANSFTVSSPGYTEDPVATVTADASGTSYIEFDFEMPNDVSPFYLQVRAGRIGAATTKFYATSSTSSHTRKLPVTFGGAPPPQAYQLAPGSPEPTPPQRTTWTNYWVDMQEVPRGAGTVTIRLHVVGTDPATQGIDFALIRLYAGSFGVPLVGMPVRISVGTVMPSYRDISITGRDDVFYGVVDSYTFLGVGPDNLQPLMRIRGRGLRAALENFLVEPDADEPRQTSRTFTAQTPGQVWSTLRLEAIRRGLPSWPTPTFSTTLDSNGDPWPTTISLSVQVGSTMLDVLRAFSELGFESKMDRDKLALYGNRAGSGSQSDPVVDLFDHDSQEQEHFGPIRNSILYRGPDGLLDEVSGFESVNANGRRETYVEAQRVGGQLLAEAALNRLSGEAIKVSVSYPYVPPREVEEPGPSFALSPATSVVPRPYVDYELGDWMKVRSLFFPGDITLRVIAIALTMDDTGQLRVVPELGDIRDDLDRQTRKVLSKLNTGTGEGAAVEFRDTVGSTASIAPSPNVTGATGVQGTLLGSTIQTVDTVSSYDAGTNLIITTGGLVVANYTGQTVGAGDDIYIVNGEAAVGTIPAGS